MSYTYLEPGQPGSFDGWEKKEQYPDRLECPKCKGYGGWNLVLDRTGLGRHSKASCSQCNGWGSVKPGVDATCIHEWQEKNIGHCLHLWTCKKGCGRSMEVDSSD